MHTGPPITIYNRVFSQFLEDFRNTNTQIPPNILEWTIEVISAATDRYAVKDDRMAKMREVLSEKLGTISVISYGKGCKCDGVITTKASIYDAYIAFFEGKNEIGSGDADPSIQGAIYYRDYWSQSSVCLILIP